MVKFDFQFMNDKYVNKLFGLLFLTFLTLIFGALYLSFMYPIFGSLTFIICFLIAAAVPIIIFQFHRKKIKQEGFAIIHDGYTEFNLKNIKTTIKYSEIKEFSIQENNGKLLNIKLNSGQKFHVASTNIYCDTNEFIKFCSAFENKFEQFQNLNNIHIRKTKSFFERKWIFPLLIILTAAIFIIVIYGLVNGKHISPIRLFGAIGPLLFLWGKYMSAKKGK